MRVPPTSPARRCAAAKVRNATSGFPITARVTPCIILPQMPICWAGVGPDGIGRRLPVGSGRFCRLLEHQADVPEQ